MEHIIVALLFVLGLFVGSFANVVILRLHSDQKGILTGRSKCPTCHHTLGVFDLIPLFSFLFLRGRCRYCTAPISIQYPLVELFTGVLFVFFPFLFGFWETTDQHLPILVFSLLFTFFFVVLFIQDLLFFEVHRFISLPAIVLSTLVSLFLLENSFITMLIGALIPTLFFGVQIIISRYIYTKKGDFVGDGDIDIGIILGVLLGPLLTTLALFIAYFIGAIVGVAILSIQKEKGAMVPFGPFLLFALVICLCAGDSILDWYLTLIGFRT